MAFDAEGTQLSIPDNKLVGYYSNFFSKTTPKLVDFLKNVKNRLFIAFFFLKNLMISLISLSFKVDKCDSTFIFKNSAAERVFLLIFYLIF